MKKISILLTTLFLLGAVDIVSANDICPSSNQITITGVEIHPPAGYRLSSSNLGDSRGQPILFIGAYLSGRILNNTQPMSVLAGDDLSCSYSAGASRGGNNTGSFSLSKTNTSGHVITLTGFKWRLTDGRWIECPDGNGNTNACSFEVS